MPDIKKAFSGHSAPALAEAERKVAEVEAAMTRQHQIIEQLERSDPMRRLGTARLTLDTLKGDLEVHQASVRILRELRRDGL
jgi:hypothetical protein